MSAEILKRITLIAAAASTAINDRDNLIRRAHRQGESLRTIAEAAGVSHEKVRQIVKEEK